VVVVLLVVAEAEPEAEVEVEVEIGREEVTTDDHAHGRQRDDRAHAMIGITTTLTSFVTAVEGEEMTIGLVDLHPQGAIETIEVGIEVRTVWGAEIDQGRRVGTVTAAHRLGAALREMMTVFLSREGIQEMCPRFKSF